MSKKQKIELNDVLEAVNKGFTSVQKQFDGIQNQFDGIQNQFDEIQNQFAAMGERFDRLESRVANLESDMKWVKDILEGHSTILKRLDEERLFMFHRQNRLEDRIEKIEKHLVAK